MISLLPVSGGFFTLANRCLSPAAVRTFHGFSLTPRASWVAGRTGLHDQLG